MGRVISAKDMVLWKYGLIIASYPRNAKLPKKIENMNCHCPYCETYQDIDSMCCKCPLSNGYTDDDSNKVPCIREGHPHNAIIKSKNNIEQYSALWEFYKFVLER